MVTPGPTIPVSDWSNPFPFHDELLQVFIPRVYYNYRIDNRAYEEPAAILFTLATRKIAFRLPRSGCLGTPLTLPQSLYGRADVRRRQNQNLSDQRLTKFAYPWCSASSAIKRFGVKYCGIFLRDVLYFIFYYKNNEYPT